MLRIPSTEENLSLTRWICSCGQRLKARSRTGGRRLRCPKCSSEVSVPLSDERSTFVEENFMLDDESGIVQRVSETARADPEPAHKDRPPVAEPPVKNLLLASAQARSGAQAPAAPKPTPPPEPALVLDGDDDVTRINPRGHTFLGEMGRVPPKGGAGDAYEVEAAPPAKPDRIRRQPVRPAKPAAKTTQPAPAAPAQVTEEEAYAQDAEEEGIHAPELLSYFNTKTGIEAAKAGAFQVLHGYWLYIPFALLAGCMVSIAQLIVKATEGNLLATITWLLLPALCSLFLCAGFVACVKDGVFERSMGIERMFYNAGVHCLRFAGAALLMVPIGVGLALAGVAIIGSVWEPAPILVKIGIVALTPAAGLFALELLLMPPVISVLEHRSPFPSLGRGLLFSLRRVWHLFTITIVSMCVGWGIAGATYLIWRLCRSLLDYALRTWNFELLQQSWLLDSLGQFFGGLVSAAVLGQLVASLMLLYLSHVGDEERLQQIKDRLRGPAAVPLRLYAAIVAAAIALLALNYFRIPSARP
jgi:hypothetical protein